MVKLDGVQKDPGFVDPRNCFVSWARPPQKVKNLIDIIQSKLKDAAPGLLSDCVDRLILMQADLWLMPLDNLHMTSLEITYSRTEAEIEALVTKFEPHCQAYADYTRTHRARLINPMLSFDAAALALSFVPAAGECLPKDRKAADDNYTYHHLRRDLYGRLKEAGIDVASRYVVPTAHLTIARFNSPNPFGGDPLSAEAGVEMKKRKRWIKEIEMINNWLEAEYWPKEQNDHMKPGGEWIVGEEKGLDIRKGRLWYGGGETVYLGKGF